MFKVDYIDKSAFYKTFAHRENCKKNKCYSSNIFTIELFHSKKDNIMHMNTYVVNSVNLYYIVILTQFHSGQWYKKRKISLDINLRNFKKYEPLVSSPLHSNPVTY